MQFQQDAQQQLEAGYKKMMDPIYDKLDKAIKAVGQAGGYTYAFDLNRTDIPYINESSSKEHYKRHQNELRNQLDSRSVYSSCSSTISFESLKYI